MPHSRWSALRAYAYVAARLAVAAALVGDGLFDLVGISAPIAHRAGFLTFADFYRFAVVAVIDCAQIVLGIALARQRARTLLTGYCLALALFEALKGTIFGPEFFHGSLVNAAFFDYLPRLAIYTVAFIFLLIPLPRVPVWHPPAEPGEKTWRKWLLASLQGEGVRPMRDRFSRGFLARVVPAMVILVLFVIAEAIALPLWAAGAPNGFVTAAIVVTVVVFFAAYGGLKRWLERIGGERYRGAVLRTVQASMQARSAEDELRRSGGRRPILYLRSFAIDAHAGGEQEVVEVLRRSGPVIAIGRPGEEFPQLGAARFYVDHQHWQAKVADIVRVAQLALWVTGTTEGLKWELSHLVEQLPPERLILWAHPHIMGLRPAEAEAEWGRFIAGAATLLPTPLPRALGDVRFFYFKKDWQTFAVSAGTGPYAQRAALLKVLVDKGLRKAVSRRRARLKLFGARLLYFGMLAAVAVLVILKLFYVG